MTCLFYYTERRSRGHVVVCFLALLLEMAQHYKSKGITENFVTYDNLLHHLERVKVVEITL
ncbi:MAG: hypothetical protein WAO51_01055 [Bacillota bacterium]